MGEIDEKNKAVFDFERFFKSFKFLAGAFKTCTYFRDVSEYYAVV